MIKNSTKFKYTFIILFPIIISVVLLAVSYKVLTSGIKLYKRAEPFIKTYIHGSPLELSEDDSSYISNSQHQVDILHYDLSFDLYSPVSVFIVLYVQMNIILMQNKLHISRILSYRVLMAVLLGQ